jgi:hypothetical protein
MEVSRPDLVKTGAQKTLYVSVVNGCFLMLVMGAAEL